MPLFLYKARTRTGERVEGTLDADSRRSAAAQVEHLGYVPVSITETQVTASVPKKTADATAKRHTFHFRAPRAAHMSTRESLTFTTELSDLLASGMNLGHALGALSRRKTGKATDDVVPAVRDAIVRGTSLSDALAAHPLVAEAAVVGRPDDTTGEAICAFVVLKRSRPVGDEAKAIAKILRDHVGKEIGPIAKPKDIRFGENLPKTRSGKIMRRLLRSLAKNEAITQDTSTLENPAILDQLTDNH